MFHSVESGKPIVGDLDEGGIDVVSLYMAGSVFDIDLGSVVVVLESNPDLVAGGQYTGEVHIDGDIGVGDCSC